MNKAKIYNQYTGKWEEVELTDEEYDAYLDSIESQINNL